ncbi:MAG: hypothetical protein AAFY16_08315 [Cyanobacteria bacterium J06642_3]
MTMKTNCYCIYCPNHPKHLQRHQLGVPITGFTADRYFDQEKFKSHVAQVDCLLPICGAIDDDIISPDDFNFPITAYGDGQSQTGFFNQGGLTLDATCANERYEA